MGHDADTTHSFHRYAPAGMAEPWGSASHAAGRPATMGRRAFVHGAAGLALGAAATLAGCASGGQPTATAASATNLPPLPAASPAQDDPFGVDVNINMQTIDEWLGRPDVIYRDVRMIVDPASFADIGGDSILSVALEGFRVTPYPYIATLQELPVAGAYSGPSLFDVAWDDAGQVVSAEPRYHESELVLEELFPRDSKIFIMCGGGGYASMMRKLLLYLGWNGDDVYNIGGAWEYSGYHPVALKETDAQGATRYYLWRADIAQIGDFSFYTPL